MNEKENRSRTVPGSMTLSVGHKDADLIGSDDKILQAGLDYLHRATAYICAPASPFAVQAKTLF